MGRAATIPDLKLPLFFPSTIRNRESHEMSAQFRGVNTRREMEHAALDQHSVIVTATGPTTWSQTRQSDWSFRAKALSTSKVMPFHLERKDDCFAQSGSVKCSRTQCAAGRKLRKTLEGATPQGER
jgi:hypothetical protein